MGLPLGGGRLCRLTLVDEVVVFSTAHTFINISTATTSISRAIILFNNCDLFTTLLTLGPLEVIASV